MSSLAKLPLGGRLADLCTEMFAFLLQLQQAEDPGEGDALRVRVNRALEEIRVRGLEKGYSEQALGSARYALVALVDEIVLTSRWACREAWLGRPLQLEQFGSFAAGEEFYARLQQLRGAIAQSPQVCDVIEVYTLCLCLGFKGKFGGVQGMDTLRKLRQELVAQIEGARGAAGVAGGELSVAWQPPAQSVQLSRDLPVRAVAVACLAGLLMIYLALLAILGHSSSVVLERVNAG